MMDEEGCIGSFVRSVRVAATVVVTEDLTELDRLGSCRDLMIADEDLLGGHCKSSSSSSGFRSCKQQQQQTAMGEQHLLDVGHSTTTIRRRSSLDRTRLRRPLTVIEDLTQIRLKRLVGSGGFGSVHVAQLNGRTVAVKRMHRCVKNRRAVAESVRAECHALRLRHPNVVRVLAVVAGRMTGGDAVAEDGKEAMVVMEYVGHRNLQSLIDDGAEELGFQRILRYCMDVASSICYIHQNRIVHLDLKPSNIVITPQDTCKLVDFGCCRSLDDDVKQPDPQCPERRSELTGTFAYRAPELLRGLDPTSKADIYSFGIVLWQLLTRDVPYAMENQHVVIFRVVAQGLRPQVPDWIDEDCAASAALKCYRNLFVACWNAAPECRPSALGVRAALSAIQCTSG